MLTVHKARGLPSDRAETARGDDFTLAAIKASEAVPSAGTSRPAAGTAPRLSTDSAVQCSREHVRAIMGDKSQTWRKVDARKTYTRKPKVCVSWAQHL